MTPDTTQPLTPVISIAIPTYNRSRRLEDTLTRLSAHPEILEDWVEIVISDNASSDNTHEVVAAFSERTGKAIRYKRNAVNVGIDGNIHAASRLATGRFLLLMSDDDHLVSGALSFLRKLVDSTPDLLFCFVNGGSFSCTYDPRECLPFIVKVDKMLVTRDPNELLQTIGVWSTFVSSFFVERKAWIDVPSPERFVGTDIYLTHILFRLLAAGGGRTCIVTAEQWLAVRSEYTGSYRVVHAFGYSLLKLLTQDALQLGLDRRAMRHIKLSVIRDVLPTKVMETRLGREKLRTLSYKELKALSRYTWWEPLAWCYLLPTALLPPSAVESLKRFKRGLLA